MVALRDHSTTLDRPSFLGRPALPLGLRIVSAERAGHTVRLASGKCTIGASPGCTLRLRGRGFQPVHCVIMRGAGGTAVRRWSNDTRLNGGHFDISQLRVGDRLAVGYVEFEVVELPDEAGFTAAAPVEPVALVSSPAVDQAQLARLADEQRSVLADLAAARAAVANMAAQVEALEATRLADECTRKSLVESNELLAGDQQQLQADLEQSRITLSAHLAKIADLELALANEQAQRSNLLAAGDERLAAFARLQEELAAATASLATQTARVLDLEASLAAEQAQSGQHSSAQEQLAAELVRLGGDLEAARESQAVYAAKVEELTSQLAAAQARCESIVAEKEALAAVRQQLESELEALRSTVTTQAARVEELQGQLTAERAAQAAVLSSQDDLAGELQRQFSAQLANAEAAAAAWQAERESLTGALTQAQAAAELARQALAAAEQRASRPSDADAQLAAAAMQQLRLDRDAATAQVAALEARCSELSGSEKALHEEIERLSGALASLKAEAAAPAPPSSADELALIRERNEELDAREVKLTRKLEEIEERETQINLYVDELARQQAEVDVAREQLAAERERFQSPVAESQPEATPQEEPASNPAATETPASTPVDLNSILARFSRENSPVGMAAAESSPAIPCEESPALPPAVEAPPARAAEEGNDEDSIEAYMARLLNRVRGEAEPALAAAPPAISERELVHEEAPLAATPPGTLGQVLSRATETSVLSRRAAAPERSEKLAAMRELANQSARVALDAHSKRQWGRTVAEKSIIAGSSLICGFALLTSPVFETSITTAFGAVVSLGTGIAWTVQAIRTFKEGRAAQFAAERSNVGLVAPQPDKDACRIMTTDEVDAIEQR